ncbi:tetratricopeptide repeat protein [Falsirhodobacter deserti]|uniref:tetratricopeptide repeat protein n=1 Tax=Falsirhodobacter deserti TaxID=1365611 RepID=UPI000FE42C69|nr:tetratricopeptide repeat protein [Falsirhodobacter deserti]
MPDQSLFRHAALALALILPAGAMAQDPGAYLAAKIAAEEGDHSTAAAWFDRALKADAGDARLLESTVIAHIASGKLDRAGAVAQTMGSLGLNSPTMYIALVDQLVKAGDWAGVIALQPDLDAVGSVMKQLVDAWAELGRGNADAAMAGFDRVAQAQGLQAFGLYHKALALALAGDLEGADAILADPDHAVANTRRGILARVQVLSQLDRADEARVVLEDSFAESDPARRMLVAALENGETLDWDIARNAQDGIAEVLYTLGSALAAEAGDTFTLIYARVATDLRPDHAEAQILVGDLLAGQGQTADALAAYDAVPDTDPLHEAAQISRADALFADDRGDEAVATLRALAEARPDALGVKVALADALRRTGDYTGSIAIYDEALGMIGSPSAQYWPVLFSRGMSHERLGQNEEAEADMRAALDLAPDQPEVLNYLGYSLVEQGRKLDEALDMIERAVAAHPDSGAIQDSLAWALFRLGRFEEAVEPMETAVLLEPADPILTDHLADIYWAVGRREEARFQWRRALIFNPEPDEVERIERKLEQGLDSVLIEEGHDDLAEKIAGQADDAR